MLGTYHGILRGSHIEWVGAAPLSTSGESGLRVEITVLEPVLSDAEELARRQRMVAALERLAERGGVASIPDPDAWQREVREDRPLPDRED
jgi:hypothetical protein